MKLSNEKNLWVYLTVTFVGIFSIIYLRTYFVLSSFNVVNERPQTSPIPLSNPTHSNPFIGVFFFCSHISLPAQIEANVQDTLFCAPWIKDPTILWIRSWLVWFLENIFCEVFVRKRYLAHRIWISSIPDLLVVCVFVCFQDFLSW